MLELHWVSIIGYIAAVLVASSFYMKTMIPLRLLAIGSNVSFILYAAFSSPILYPVLALHIFLLPLNIIRLWQIKKLIDGVRAYAKQDYSLEWLIPYMKKESYAANSTLFQKGDRADKMFLIQKGQMYFPEIHRTVGPGELIGEMGMLSQHRTRTTSAIVGTEPIELLSITEAQVMTLYYQNPSFGLFLLKTIIKRATENYDLKDIKSTAIATP